MQQIPDDNNGCKPFGPLAETFVMNSIHTAPDDGIRKQRILLAREAGILSDKEAENWIAILDLRCA